MQQDSYGQYQIFFGDTYINLMPQLIDAGLVPLTVADVMRGRLEALNSTDLKDKGFWLYNFFETSDGIAYNSDMMTSNVKIVHHVPELLNINPNSELSRGALILTSRQYRDLEGPEYSMRKLESARLGEPLSAKKVKSHRVWRALAQDEYLLSEYVDYMFEELIKRDTRKFDNVENPFMPKIKLDYRAMDVHLGHKQRKPTLRHWLIGNILRDSYIRGDRDLDLGARLVGFRPEIPEQTGTLDEEVQEALEAGETFKHGGRTWISFPKGDAGEP